MYIRVSSKVFKILMLLGLTPRESDLIGLEPWLKMEVGWFCSPEMKYLETFLILTAGERGVSSI